MMSWQEAPTLGKKHLAVSGRDQMDDAIKTSLQLENVFDVVFSEYQAQAAATCESGPGGTLNERSHDGSN